MYILIYVSILMINLCETNSLLNGHNDIKRLDIITLFNIYYV